MTPDEQLIEWVAGRSVHNDERDECCPDFSCCKPELLAEPFERVAFAAANEETRGHMLMGFLGRAIAEAAPDTDVHIAGGPYERGG